MPSVFNSMMLKRESLVIERACYRNRNFLVTQLIVRAARILSPPVPSDRTSHVHRKEYDLQPRERKVTARSCKMITWSLSTQHGLKESTIRAKEAGKKEQVYPRVSRRSFPMP